MEETKIKDKNSASDKDKSFIEACTIEVDETKKSGIQIKGKDVLYLNAPLLIPSKDTPLLTEAPDIVGAINELFQSGSGGGDEYNYIYDPDWDIFCNAPNPNHNQAVIGIRILDPTVKREYRGSFYAAVQLAVSRPIFINNTDRQLPAYTVDWGDGTITSMPRIEYNDERKEEWYTSLMHTYEEAGTYVVVVTLEDNEYAYTSNFSDGSYTMRGASLQLKLDPSYHTNKNQFKTVTPVINYKSPICIFAKVGTMFCITYEPHTAKYEYMKGRGGLGFYTFGCSHITIKYLQYPMVLQSSNTTYKYDLFDNMTALQYLKFVPLPAITEERMPPLEIPAELFYSNLALEKIDGVDWSKITTEVAPLRMFNMCYSIDLPKEMYFTDLSSYAFVGIYRRKKLSFPNCIHISQYSFMGSYGIEEIELPECIEVDDYAFSGLTNLRKVLLPKCTKIGNYAFQSCNSLNEITVADGCTFGERCFTGCYSLYPRPDGSVN